MSLPTFDDWERPPIAGDVHDDDARVLDSLVESHAEPPTVREQPTAPVEALRQPEPETRLLTGTVTLLPGWDAMPLLPADASRTALTVSAYSTVSGEAIRLADDRGKLFSPSQSFMVRHEASFSGPHTGPVWIVADPAATGTLTVTYVAVTK